MDNRLTCSWSAEAGRVGTNLLALLLPHCLVTCRSDCTEEAAMPTPPPRAQQHWGGGDSHDHSLHALSPAEDQAITQRQVAGPACLHLISLSLCSVNKWGCHLYWATERGEICLSPTPASLEHSSGVVISRLWSLSLEAMLAICIPEIILQVT